MENKEINVLFAEDENTLGLIVKESLETKNFKVHHCKDGEEAFDFYCKNKPDILVLDIMMPKKDGLTLANDIRKLDKNIPIIFLTAKSQVEDVIEGFNHGGNDYLKKPFSMEELIIRIEALLGRNLVSENKDTEYKIGSFSFDYNKQELTDPTGDMENLTHKEAILLKLLIENKNEILNKSIVLNKIWGKDDFFNGRSMDVFITRLRKKLASDPNIQIKNIRGRGYKLIF